MTQTAPFPKLKRGLVAILRGLKPSEAVAIGQVLFDAGIEAIEVPLNSPEPFVSIASIVAALPRTALVGAGTLRNPATVGGAARVAFGRSDTVVAPPAAMPSSGVPLPSTASATGGCTVVSTGSGVTTAPASGTTLLSS